MRYALLIYQDNAFEEDWANADDDRRRALYAEYGKFGRLLEQRNAMVGGSELAVSRTATTVRKRNGDVAITDGPFAEVAEQLGGFYIVEARDIDEALELARALPSDVVEVRPVIEAGDRPDG
jgi:hypothetical protein